MVDRAADRLKSAAGGVLGRNARPGGDERGRTSPPPARPVPRQSAPLRTPSVAGPSMSRVREQAERLEAGISRVGNNDTAVEQLVRQNTKAQLMRRAHELEIKGRSRMTKQQLAEEIAARV